MLKLSTYDQYSHNLQSDPLRMKNWEEMKDFSYVGIKITKAKTISEGLTKCKMEKLTRRNPLYEHINFHKLIFGKKECQLCKSISPQIQISQSPYIQKRSNKLTSASDNKRSKTQPVSREKHRPITKNQYKSWAKLQTAIESTLKEQTVDKSKIAANKFDNCLNKTKSTFFKLKNNEKIINDNFLTQIEEPQFKIFRDRDSVIAQAKSDRMMMLDEKEQEERRRRSTSKKIKDMKRPVQFPLSQSQIKKIVDNQSNIRKTETVKLKKMMSSLYDYKSKINFQNKMKIVKKLTEK